MGKVIDINIARRRKKAQRDLVLLSPIADKNLKGRWPIKIVCTYLVELLGTNLGYTDFVETAPGYVSVYLPTKKAFADMYKDTFEEI